MADQIVSTLGFDVSEALAALQRLDTALKGTEAAMKGFADSTRNLPTVTSALSTVGNSFKEHMGHAQQATQSLTVSWQTMARIVTTQAIVRALSMIRNAFNNAVEGAVKFERQIALIQTIDPTASFEQTADAVRKLSDTFNIPLAEAGAGVYQAISNQVGDFGKSLEFTTEAAKFAKATNSSLKDSVDLLSGALASYGMTAEETSKVSGVFFSVIDKGRVTATEIANKFGTIGPLAAQLGVQLEDLGGALAAVSVKGSNSAHSLTMLRGILSGLQKPTPELVKEFDRLGFATVETALATEHLDGLLKSITAGKTSQELGKLFPNIRATSGVSSLASDFKTLANDIEAARKAGANFAEDKFLTATKTNAEKVTAELNRLRNALAVDLGRSVLQAIADLSKLVGGSEEVIRVVKALGPVLLGAGAGFLTLRASIAAAHLEAKGLSKALGALAMLPVAVGVGTSIGQWIGSKMEEDAFNTLRTLAEADTKALDEFKRQQSEKRDAANKTDDARVQSALKVVQTLNQSYLADVGNAKRANDTLLRNMEAHLNKMFQTRERMVQELAKQRVEAEEGSKASQARVTDLTVKTEEREFGQKTRGLDDAQKVYALTSRSSDLASKAASDLMKAAGAGDKAAMDRALALFATAQRVGEEAQSIAQRTEDRSLEAKAARELESTTQRQISAERELQSILNARSAALEQQEEKQRAVVDSMRDAIKVLLDNSKMFTKEGQPLPAEQLARQAAARQEALRTIAGAALSQKDLTAMGALGLADFVSRFSSELTKQPVKLQFEVESEIQRIQGQLQQSFAQFKVRFGVENVQALETALGTKFQTPDEMARGLTQATKKAQELRAAFDAQQSAQQGANQTLATSATATEEALGRVANRMATFKGMPFAEQTETALTALRNALADPALSLEKVRAVADAIKPLAERGGWKFGAGVNTQNVDDLSAALESLKQRSEAIKTLQAPPVDTKQLDALERIIGQLPQASTALANVGPNVSAGVLPSKQIADNLWSAAMAAGMIDLAAEGQGYAHGGTARYLAAGGPKGTDTIPAMLSPGEFIMSARASRRFSAQLTAMNAGVRPVFRSEGGVTTNVGDISFNGGINIGGGKSADGTARQLMGAIRRELRRGTGVL